MPADLVRTFEKDGLVYPLRAISGSEAAQVLSAYEAMERAFGGRVPQSRNAKAHLLFPTFFRLVCDRRIVAPVREILGPDVLCWQFNVMCKNANSGSHVTWHQDATFYGLSEPRGVTAWLALTPSTLANGCVKFVPGSHGTQHRHWRHDDPDNLLPFSEEIEVPVDPRDAVAVELEPGEMSLHNMMIVHGSEPNRSDGRRIGVAIRYIAGDIAQRGDSRGTATLVCGRDHGTFELEKEPVADLDPDARAHHDDVMRRWLRTVTTTFCAVREAQGDRHRKTI